MLRGLTLCSALLVLGFAAPARADLSPVTILAAGPTTATVSVYGSWDDGAAHTVTVRYGHASAYEQTGDTVTVPAGSDATFQLTGLDAAARYVFAFDDDAGETSATSALLTTGSGTPANLVAPAVVPAGDGESVCDLGRWDDPSATLSVRPPYGRAIRCVVIATNAAGTSTAASLNVLSGGALAYAAPVFWAPPTVTGGDGALSCRPGANSGGGGILRIAYAWLRDGTAIATGSDYTLVGADAGHVLTCRVTLSNGAGSAQADSSGVSVQALPVASTPAAPVVLPAGAQRASSSIAPTDALARLVAQADRLTARGRQAWTFLAPGPGRLTVTVSRAGRTLARGSAHAAGPGLLSVHTAETKLGRLALRDVRRRVLVTVAFTPAGARKPFTRRKSVAL